MSTGKRNTLFWRWIRAPQQNENTDRTSFRSFMFYWHGYIEEFYFLFFIFVFRSSLWWLLSFGIYLRRLVFLVRTRGGQQFAFFIFSLLSDILHFISCLLLYSSCHPDTQLDSSFIFRYYTLQPEGYFPYLQYIHTRLDSLLHGYTWLYISHQ